ncbi:hypothetical protein M427DRAFT_61977 [Gonapodya prolifera JEL478]|uniref:Uncharacterized protein n=1 Tax=Gonapodya prolifera (strain JEL478) TaxID=1344416 RepID=A0A139A0Y7_GONPJ|nr:hypothetical protein M427DRAFT_61977 [Gonapodya prolifera JEL478]|eukprot:KXS10439.1 hypothetical protein M427DRAFT_61977 [Gonapodya prolifera JEL478]
MESPDAVTDSAHHRAAIERNTPMEVLLVQERTKQMQEKTKQMNYKIELLKLQWKLGTLANGRTGDGTSGTVPREEVPIGAEVPGHRATIEHTSGISFAEDMLSDDVPEIPVIGRVTPSENGSDDGSDDMSDNGSNADDGNEEVNEDNEGNEDIEMIVSNAVRSRTALWTLFWSECMETSYGQHFISLPLRERTTLGPSTMVTTIIYSAGDCVQS